MLSRPAAAVSGVAMEPAHLQRKLAAILYADVAGYSRLTGQDEEGTHRRLSACLDLISGQVARRGGRVVHYAGDAVLADFATVLDAVTCAVEVQRALREGDDVAPGGDRVQFRIGINLGDVIVDRDDIYGDGVNIAARLESLAEPGGICVSGTVYDALGNRLPLALEFMGEKEVKNIAAPVRAYRVVMSGVSAAPDEAPRAARRPLRARVAVAIAGTGALVLGVAWVLLGGGRGAGEPAPETAAAVATPPAAETPRPGPRPDAPSIAVLPFANLGDDPEQEYFSDGLTEDLITDLSRVSGLLVIARASAFAYKGRQVNVRRVASDLGVRYVLEGSVRRSAGRVRINAQLIDADSGMHLWAQRYDRELTDVFALQDEVTRTIVGALAVNLTRQDRARLEPAPRVNPQAYDLLLRGNERLNQYTPDSVAQARELYEQAIALDPDYARAHANVAFSHVIAVTFGWAKDRDAALRQALARAEQALALDDRIPQIHFTLANIHLVHGRPEAARIAAQRSVEVDPNYADGFLMLAIALTFAGELDEALAAVERANRINPHQSYMYLWVHGRILFHQERYAEAAGLLEQSVERNASFDQAHLMLAATYGQMGRTDDAEWQAQEVLSLRPGFTLSAERERQQRYKRTRDLALYIEGLRRAGLPD